ncbi:hypothetical protein HZ326_6713 [Fusarium oxysporum f. sp. albedinis]|nr:hypothetical protein HZ326_6713 [Fusarium oxysporum f. sp. albedinis]
MDERVVGHDGDARSSHFGSSILSPTARSCHDHRHANAHCRAVIPGLTSPMPESNPEEFPTPSIAGQIILLGRNGCGTI